MGSARPCWLLVHGTLGPALSPPLSAGAPVPLPRMARLRRICQELPGYWGWAARGWLYERNGAPGALLHPVWPESSFPASFLPIPVQLVPCQEEQGQALAKFAWVMHLTGAFLSLKGDVSALGRGCQCSGRESLVNAAPSV